MTPPCSFCMSVPIGEMIQFLRRDRRHGAMMDGLLTSGGWFVWELLAGWWMSMFDVYVGRGRRLERGAAGWSRSL